ncbi:MAG: hypothetical protein V8S86_00040 [Eubacteriales bacterium]
MAYRIPWDKYEAAILLDTCLRVDQGVFDCSSAITLVSIILRNRAIHRGLEIDNIFRNENGISMQLSAMTNCLHHKSGGLTISKIFRDTVELYESDKKAFDTLVREAMELDFENKKERTFASWLEEQSEYIVSAQLIINSLNLVSALYLKFGTINEPIIKINSAEKVKQVLSTLYKNQTPHIHSRKQLHEYIYAIKTFLKYLEAREITDRPTLSNTSQNSEIVELRVDFVNPVGFSYTRPDYFQFTGSEAIPIKNWTKLYVGVVNELCLRNPELLESLVGKNISGGRRVDFLKADQLYQMTAPHVIESGLVIETNLSATDIIKKIRALLDLYNIPYDSLAIFYHKRNQAPISATTSHSTLTWIPQFTKQVTQILKEHYSYGFRIASPIEMMRFRNYAEDSAVLLPNSDEELSKEITAAGILVDGKIFVFSEDTLSKFEELINSVFDSGATVVFMEPFVDRNSEWLEEHHILSAEIVKEVIKKRRPDLYCGQNIITTGKKETEFEAVVSEIHRVSEGKNIIWSTDLCEQLPYVPSNKIAWSLSVSDDFVWISEGKYFVMNHFIINDEEETAIRDYVASECHRKGYASITDLPFGSIPEQNYELSITGLYSAVYIAVLKQQYKLNGKILTCDGSNIDIVLLLKNYCQEKISCSLTDIINKAIELVGAPNRQNSFVALYDTMIRVDKEYFVSDSQIQFDVDRIDCVLHGIIGNRFAAIKSITTFALFPPCGHSWNHYLLESFCYRFSKKYKLCVLNYNDKNVGIIATNSTDFSYTDMLCETAAKANVPLTTEAVGQYFFENGFTAKRKFSSLPEIIEKAITLREEG